MKSSLPIMLRELRERRGWSRVKCAMRLGVSVRAVRSWEAGSRRRTQLFRIASQSDETLIWSFTIKG